MTECDFRSVNDDGKRVVVIRRMKAMKTAGVLRSRDGSFFCLIFSSPPTIPGRRYVK